MLMELYGCGLDAHGQLKSDGGHENITTFQRIGAGSHTKVLCATLAATIIDVDGRLTYHGYHKSGVTGNIASNSQVIRSVIGDIDGIYGALTVEGDLLKLDGDRLSHNTLHLRVTKQNWWRRERLSLEHIAVGGNGQVAVITTCT